MQLTNLCFMLLGALLVAGGVLASALADRIRNLKITREGQPRERASRATGATGTPIPVIDAAELSRPAAKAPRPPRAETKPDATTIGEDVIAAIVAAGHKKAIAIEATWACTAAERATIEGWTAAALRRCARGGLS